MQDKFDLTELLRQEGRPLSTEEVFAACEDHDAAAAAISRLLSSGKILMTRKKKLALPEQTGLIAGRIQGNAKGFGFFLPEDGSPDAYISEEDMHGAMHGDKVWARLTDGVSKNGSQEAEVALIYERAYKRIVGTIEFDRYDAYIIPDDRKIAEDMLVLPQDTMGAKLGDKVVAEILSYPDGRRPMIGRVIEVLGSRRDAGTDVLSIVRQYD
ncbi:MAG: ribonuclease R, partial [Clostridia bacterium]|nr:ribonuclease R [Clostridia bacterium]